MWVWCAREFRLAHRCRGAAELSSRISFLRTSPVSKKQLGRVFDSSSQNFTPGLFSFNRTLPPPCNHTDHSFTMILHVFTFLAMAAATTTAGEFRTDTSSPLQRMTGLQTARHLHHPHPSSTSSPSSYQGCLSYSSDELSAKWTFTGQAPACSWTHTGSSDGGSSYSTNSGGSGGGGNSNGSGSGGGGGNSNGSGSGSGGVESSTGNSGSSGGNGNSGSGNNGNSGSQNANGDGENNDSSNAGNGNYDNSGNQQAGEVVVSNEDISGGGSDYDPISDFNIGTCDTYENLWLWDLSLSCNASSVKDSLDGCNCTFAAELMESGYLSCEDASLCPRSCAICSTCMSLLGCESIPTNPMIAELVSSKFLFYLIAAAVALSLIMLAAYARNRRRSQDDLKKSLLEEQFRGQLGKDFDPEKCMYIDTPWKASSPNSGTSDTIQQTNTMSTSSASRLFEERNDAIAGTSLLGERKASGDSNEEELSASLGFPTYPMPQTTSGVKVVHATMMRGHDTVSPISSPGGSLIGAETNNDVGEENTKLKEIDCEDEGRVELS